MLTTLTDYNKVTQQLLMIYYTCVPDVVNNTNCFRITRYASKQYSYIGLDMESAEQGALDKVKQYTRFIRRYDIQNGQVVWSSGGMLSQAQIQATRDDGGLYSVDIQVNEVDEVLSLTDMPDYSKAFTWIASDYDGNNPTLVITNIERVDQRPTLYYRCSVPEYNPTLAYNNHLIIESIPQDQSTDWVQETYHATYETETSTGVYEGWMSTEDYHLNHSRYYRMKCYNVITNEVYAYSPMYFIPKIATAI